MDSLNKYKSTIEDRHDLSAAGAAGDNDPWVFSCEVQWSDTAEAKLEFFNFEFIEHDFGHKFEDVSWSVYFL